jgi:hypothetical protein
MNRTLLAAAAVAVLIPAHARADDRLDRAMALLHWAAPQIALDFDGARATRNTTALLQEKDPSPPEEGGTSCAGMAVFLDKVLKQAGYDSFTIDIGYPGTFVTHVTVVLALPGPYGRRFYILDPTFGGTYEDRGEPIDLETMLWSGRGRFRASGVSRAAFVTDKYLSLFLAKVREAGASAECLPNEAGATCQMRYTVPYAEAILRPELARVGIAPEADFIMALLRHKVISVGPSGAAARADFLKLLANAAIEAPVS